MKLNEMELLNSEGPILKLVKIDANEFVIYDRDDSIVEVLDKSEIIEFIYGTKKLQDSSGKCWVYNEQTNDMKPNQNIIEEFIGYKC